MPKRSEATWQEAVHLLAAFDAVFEAFSRSGDHEARKFAEPGKASQEGFHQILASGRDGKWPPGLLTGFRQGAREIDTLLRVLPEAEREQASREVERAGGAWYRQLVSGNRGKVQKIVERGEIKSEDEFYATRHRVDELEGCGGTENELAVLYRLLDDYQMSGSAD